MTQLTAALAAALAACDPNDDGQWTADGQIQVKFVNAQLEAMGADPVTRQDIIDQAPQLIRESAAEFVEGYRAAVQGMRATVADATAPAAVVPSVGLDQVHVGGAPDPGKTPEHGAEREKSKPEGGVSVCDMPLSALISSVDMLERAIVEIDLRCQNLVRMRTQIDDDLRSLGVKADACSRQLSRMKPKERSDQSGIRDYLDRQRKNREERAARTQRFLDHGVTAQDVAKELRGASPLDAAMKRRKPEIGSTRPDPRMPVQRGSTVVEQGPGTGSRG